MAYGRAASGIQLSTHVSGGGLSAGWEEEEVERGEAGEKWLGSRILAYSESGEKADADADAGCLLAAATMALIFNPDPNRAIV